MRPRMMRPRIVKFNGEWCVFVSRVCLAFGMYRKVLPQAIEYCNERSPKGKLILLPDHSPRDRDVKSVSFVRIIRDYPDLLRLQT